MLYKDDKNTAVKRYIVHSANGCYVEHQEFDTIEEVVNSVHNYLHNSSLDSDEFEQDMLSVFDTKELKFLNLSVKSVLEVKLS